MRGSKRRFSETDLPRVECYQLDDFLGVTQEALHGHSLDEESQEIDQYFVIQGMKSESFLRGL